MGRMGVGVGREMQRIDNEQLQLVTTTVKVGKDDSQNVLSLGHVKTFDPEDVTHSLGGDEDRSRGEQGCGLYFW